MKTMQEILNTTEAAKAMGLGITDTLSVKNKLADRGITPICFSTYIDKDGNKCYRYFYEAAVIRNQNAKAKADLMAEKARIERELAKYA